MSSIVILIVTGFLAGWLSSVVVRGRGFGCLGDVVVGILGALIGGWILKQLGAQTSGLAGFFVSAVLGAVVLLSVVKIVKKA